MVHRLAWVTVLLLAASGLSRADDRDRIVRQKDDLQQIKADLDRGKATLDSLKQAELSVQNRISDYDDRLATDQVVIGRLNDQLRQVRSEINQAARNLEANQDNYDRTRRRFLGNLRQFYLSSRQPIPPLIQSANRELILQRQIEYLTALSSYESGTVVDASQLLQESQASLTDLSGEKAKVSSLKDDKEAAAALLRSRKERQQKELSRLYREKTETADQVQMLLAAAQEMENIIARLERQQAPPQIYDAEGQVSVFAHLQGSLSPPCAGDVVETFGEKIDPITKLRSFSPGIVLRCCRGCEVSSVAPGQVAYVGELRGVGKFVIIDHGGNYFSTYAGIEKVAVSTGRMIAAGGIIALIGSDGRLRFELRTGRKPVDPLDWIRFDGL